MFDLVISEDGVRKGKNVHEVVRIIELTRPRPYMLAWTLVTINPNQGHDTGL